MVSQMKPFSSSARVRVRIVIAHCHSLKICKSCSTPQQQKQTGKCHASIGSSKLILHELCYSKCPLTPQYCKSRAGAAHVHSITLHVHSALLHRATAEECSRTQMRRAVQLIWAEKTAC